MYPLYIVFVRVLTSLILLVHKASASLTVFKFNCSDTTAAPGDNSYNVNLNYLLSSLDSKNDLNRDTNGLFSDITVNPDESFNDTVYAQYLCQGDYTIDECKSCVSNAATHLALNCSKSTSGYIWYEGCPLSFSNANMQFNDVYNLSSTLVWFEERNTPQLDDNETNLLGAFVVITMKDLAERVAKADNDVHEIQSSSLASKYFGIKEVKFVVSDQVNITLYEMVQCSPNLSVRDCNTCLTSAINELGNYSNGVFGGRVGIHNCIIRYETYRFYRLTDDLDSFSSPPIKSTTETPRKGSDRIKVVIAITIPVSIVLAFSIIGLGLCARKVRSKKVVIVDMGNDDFDAIESFQYNLSDIEVATNDFSDDNKIGQGGFGSVYKGVLKNGQQIAVKKLLLSLGKMEEAFKNEVEVVAKLQHRNLVRLLGYCLAKDAKLLVFEYVPNKSLDKVLFAPEEEVQLDWLTRFKIIVGIARGLLYLHEDFRLRIVHRDLKPGNILLDEEMNPKIADFGLARIFGIKQTLGAPTNTNASHSTGVDPTHQSTQRGGGTLGYMAPECARRQQFSVKTDVYSFGVLILEIVSRKRNSRFHLTGLADDLLSYAWMKWDTGSALEFMDGPLTSSRPYINEETRQQGLTCIHLGLLCVQRDAKARPTMGTIVHKLIYPSENSLPLPQQPATVDFPISSLPASSSFNEYSPTDLAYPS